MSKSTSAATECGQSVVEFLSLGIVAAKKLRMNTLPIDLNMAQSILDLLRNPPQESIPSPRPCPLCNTNLDHQYEAHECISPHESPPPLVPATRLTDAEVSARVRPRSVSASERAALKDAGRGWHRGM